MYPRFIKQAKSDGNQDAVQSFEYAKEAEAEHFKLFTAAASSLHKGEARDYFVCTVSGYTMSQLDATKMPWRDLRDREMRNALQLTAILTKYERVRCEGY